VNDDASGGMTLHELAAEYGVSAERIRQIEVAALRKMRRRWRRPTADRRARPAGLPSHSEQDLQVAHQCVGHPCRGARTGGHAGW
jgi:hypothetical protein